MDFNQTANFKETHDNLDKIQLTSKIIDYRSEEFKQISRDITEINELYQDLADLVEDQAQPLNQVEQQITVSSLNTKKGLDDIQKASKKQVKCLIQ